MLLDYLSLYSNSVWFAGSGPNFLPHIKLSNTFSSLLLISHYYLLLSNMFLPHPWHARGRELLATRGWKLQFHLCWPHCGIQAFPHLSLHVLGIHKALEFMKFQLLGRCSFLTKRSQQDFSYSRDECLLSFHSSNCVPIYCLCYFKRL